MGAGWVLSLPLGGIPRSKLGPRGTTAMKGQLNWAPAPARLWAGASVSLIRTMSEPWKGLPPAQLVDGETEALEA